MSGIYCLFTRWCHLLERKHNQRFISLMDLHLPNWREHREKLNKMPLAFNRWGY
ncbi:YgjP-like metallopeptidase domain-containing protein [Aeromonas hydrophila]|uniref:YgjP-like metallopeptidase domain-containing protein n=1 Tax=Aeromonas hydrophila TaxID=644 RepID=UPI0030C67F2E